MRRTFALVTLVGLLALGAAGCASSKKNAGGFVIADPNQAFVQSMEQLQHGKTDNARSTCESVDFRFAADRRAEMEPLIKICIADATFYKGTTIDLIDARQLYIDFVTLFGDNPLAPYAQFQAGVCSLEQANHPSKDQTQTRAAFDDLAEVERRYPDSPYARAARDMIVKAETRLAEHEFLVGRFYLKRKIYDAAVTRFRVILDTYPSYPEMEKLYYNLGRALVMKTQGDSEGRKYLERVVDDYPRGEYHNQAEKLLATRGTALDLSVQ